MKQTKNFTTFDIVNIVEWYNNIRQNKTNKLDILPIKVQWGLKKNMDILLPIAKSFEEFRKELDDKLKTDFFNDEKSEITKIKTTNENGEEIEQDGRQIKEEYMQEYQKSYEELNQKIVEIAMENNELSLSVFDLDIIFDSFDDMETGLSMDDINMLSFMDADSQ